MASLAREVFDDRTANVLRGQVSLANNGGFIQMAVDLAPSQAGLRAPVDASRFTGVELDVQCFTESEDSCTTDTFNIHIKTTDCPKPFSSYRAAFDAPCGGWGTVRLPFAEFEPKGPGIENDNLAFRTSALTRLGVVAIGIARKVKLAIAGVRFY